MKGGSETMTRKLSTNQKLAEFLNKSEIQDEEAEALDHEEKRARERLRVTSLYGAGARFKTPKTKVRNKSKVEPELFIFLTEKIKDRAVALPVVHSERNLWK
jgi:hypothetical protein